MNNHAVAVLSATGRTRKRRVANITSQASRLGPDRWLIPHEWLRNLVDAARCMAETRDMSSASAETGGCLCGAVTFSVSGPLRDVINCYCENCRHFTGHHMAATSTDVADVSIEDATQQLTWHPVP